MKLYTRRHEGFSLLFKDRIEKLGNKPLHAFFESMGGLPMLGEAPGGGWDSNNYSLEDLIVNSIHMTPSTPVIRIAIIDTGRVKDKYVLTVSRI